MTDSRKHEEWDKLNSLTSPADFKSYQPKQGFPNLTEPEVVNAMDELDDRNHVLKFPKVERRFADPVEPMQRIGLISFVPAKGASPNEDGVYGFAKIRGCYPTDTEASERAEFLIRNVDSYHKIYHCYVGRPFPLTLSTKYSSETTEIDVRRSMTDSISTNIKNMKKDEMQQVKEIEEREKLLLEDSKKDDEDPTDYYTTLKVKKAQLTWTYLETKKKMDEMKDIIVKTRTQIEEMDKTDQSFSKNYFAKYCKARTDSGLDNATNQENFMKFLVEDATLDF